MKLPQIRVPFRRRRRDPNLLHEAGWFRIDYRPEAAPGLQMVVTFLYVPQLRLGIGDADELGAALTATSAEARARSLPSSTTQRSGRSVRS